MAAKGFAKSEAGSRRATSPQEEERRLLTEAREGDPRALRRLLERLSPPIYRFGRSFCGDDDDAQDVMQEVLVSLVRSLPSIRGDSSLTTWAYTVARRACRRQRRRSDRGTDGLPGRDAANAEGLPAPSDGSDPAADLERRELAAALADAVRQLPPAHREAVILRDIEGLRAREAARVLGVTERALKSRLHRARLALRDALAPRFGGRPRARHGRSCGETGRLLNRYLDGELNRAACKAMQAHLEACPACGRACRALRGALDLCRRPGARRLGPEARESLRTAIRGALEEIGAGA
jgi:RNA polymerase sigma-70 factor, ECF subfamily